MYASLGYFGDLRIDSDSYACGTGVLGSCVTRYSENSSLAVHLPGSRRATGNIGTPEHPIIEGSPLDLIPVFVGVPLGIPIYALLTYLVLRMVAIVRDRMGQRNHRVP